MISPPPTEVICSAFMNCCLSLCIIGIKIEGLPTVPTSNTVEAPDLPINMLAIAKSSAGFVKNGLISAFTPIFL